jgi:hypothetical protein
VFKLATKKQSRLRLGLIGPAGSGKTYSALAIASHLGKRVAVIDTERGSASLYSDAFTFDVCELESFEPTRYVDAIQAADRAKYDVIVIDSLSHAWSGKGGALEQVDLVAKRSRSGSSFNAWREVTPMHNALVDAILQARCHVIVTMRSKTEYVLETNDKGKQVPRKVGMAPIQRDGMEYEFTVVGDLDLDHNLVVTKTRCSKLDGAVVHRPGEQLASTLLEWLNTGAPEAERPAPSYEVGSGSSIGLAEQRITDVAGKSPEPPAPAVSEVDALTKAIDDAPTPDALAALIPRLQAAPPADKPALRAFYNARRAKLEETAGAAQ